MYYAVTKVNDAEMLHRLHPSIPVHRFKEFIRGVLERYAKHEAAICINRHNDLEYCYLNFYKNSNSGAYGEQGYLYKRIKYNKEQVCAK